MKSGLYKGPWEYDAPGPVMAKCAIQLDNTVSSLNKSSTNRADWTRDDTKNHGRGRQATLRRSWSLFHTR